ncbi:two component transcriptional regulator, winged helix family [Thermosinus carboxydivorans Nor1]|uniref:Two component transcriptional regulator, winged helix family n=1 Tax=Thermosinus carboxydivorans Nor1 TaxID=401526 RepID=A1HRN0_9FIRM|nr:response regulator transcription factor [Thermosinus carboxydivorans]EAX47354.1 two component transcriptional regulator, winged helix family [Thermosinus carboxydivorans Nor1]
MSKNSVLIVDDDVKIAALLKAYFEKDGFITYIAHDGYQALDKIREQKPDIVVLDLMLPGIDGWEVCRRARKIGDIPILMLTARDEEADRLIGLEMGADDYVTKPFSAREVVARVRAILRRSHKIAAQPEPIKVGNLLIDAERHVIIKDDEILDMTPTEFKILQLLATNKGRVFSRLQLIEQVQGYASEGYERTIDVHIKNIRRKIENNPKEPKYIITVYGVGYKFAGDDNV